MDDSPAGTGWSNMGGGGDEHIGRGGKLGGAEWDEEWGGPEGLDEVPEESGPYGEEKSEDEEEEK